MNDPLQIDGKNVIVNVSGGAGSAVALIRCLEWYGKQRTIPVFADTKTEAPDLYELLESLESKLGIRIHRLDQDMDIWDCFDKYGVITLKHAGGACKASVELKQKPLAKFALKHGTPEDAVIATGLSWMESNRQERMTNRLLPYTAVYPLNVSPRLSACQLIAELEKNGLPTPSAYDLGYSHNNCGGTCVLAGIKQWAGVLQDFPERFDYAERRESQILENHRRNFTVLRDRRGGTSRPYPLSELRDDVEQGRELSDEWRSTCNCMGLEGPVQPTLFEL